MNFCDITTIICVYNKSKFLERCINSVLSQSIKPKRIICINDFSNDDSKLILEKYQSIFPNLFIIINNIKNLGLTASRNIALQYVETQYVAFLDGDDYWCHTKLEKQFFLLDSGADVVYNAYLWTQNGVIDKKRFCLPPSLSGPSITEALLEGNLISGSASSVVCRYKNLVIAGYSDRNLKEISNDFGEDWDLWLRLSKFSKFNFTNETLTFLDDSGLYSSGPKDLESKIKSFKAHYYIRSKHFSDYRSTVINWQVNEYIQILKQIDNNAVLLLNDWMSEWHKELSEEVIKIRSY